MTKELGLEGAKGVDTPSSKLTGAGCRTSDKPLDAAEASRFRHLAGTALYLSLDRPSIQYALSEITAGMAKPCEIHMLRLKRLGRYLLKFPTETWLFALQEEPEEFQVYTDSDWASDAVTRRSMSCHMERFGEHLLDSGCAKQSTVALSSGEAEYYSLTRGAAIGLLTKHILQCVGFNRVKQVMLTDSTAAKGIAQRSGTGKVKHLSIRELWLQEKVRARELAVRKESTTTNWADLGTKSLTGPRISELVQIMPLCRRGIVVACLLCMMNCAAAQPEDEEKDSSIFSFVLYMFVVHILALYGLFSAVRRRFMEEEICEKMIQTDEIRADNRTTQTSTAQSTASSSTSMPVSGHGGEQRQNPKAKPKPKAEAREPQDDLVAILGGGVRYHRMSCGMVRAFRGNVQNCRRSLAVERGYTPCKQCGG